MSSDFKRQQAPRRRISLKTQQGFRTASDLRKYPDLFNDAWGLLSKSPQEMTLKFGRRSYRAQMSPLLRNLISQFVAQIQAQHFQEVRASVARKARELVPKGLANPEKFSQQVLDHFYEQAAIQVVRALLALLEGPFKENACSAEDSIFEVESGLTPRLERRGFPRNSW